MSAPPALETRKLRLRPLAVDDAGALHAIYSDAEAMRYWSHAPNVSLDETRDRIACHVADPAWRAWAITRQGDDTAIGSLAAQEKRQGGVVEIGYSLVRTEWRMGIAREAVARLLDYLFEEQGMRRVFADTDPDNAASNRLLEDLGFTCEGRLRGEWHTHIGVRDSFIWGCLPRNGATGVKRSHAATHRSIPRPSVRHFPG